jgi:hypothetical protein
MREENDALYQEVKLLETESQRLERQLLLLKTQEGIIRAARERGWVMPHERRLSLPSP